MLNRSQTTTLLQNFCELSLPAQVIFESMRVADNTFKVNSECEWVKTSHLIESFSHQKWSTRVARAAIHFYHP